MPTTTKINIYLGTGEAGYLLEGKIKKAAAIEGMTTNAWVVEAIKKQLHTMPLDL